MAALSWNSKCQEEGPLQQPGSTDRFLCAAQIYVTLCPEIFYLWPVFVCPLGHGKAILQ